MDIANFEEKMQAYTIKQHRGFLTYFATLSQKGFTIENLREYVEFKRAELKELEQLRQRELEDVIPKCPKCGLALILRPISTPKGRANVFGYRSCFECLDCAYERYSTKRLADVIMDLYSRRIPK